MAGRRTIVVVDFAAVVAADVDAAAAVLAADVDAAAAVVAADVDAAVVAVVVVVAEGSCESRSLSTVKSMVVESIAVVLGRWTFLALCSSSVIIFSNRNLHCFLSCIGSMLFRGEVRVAVDVAILVVVFFVFFWGNSIGSTLVLFALAFAEVFAAGAVAAAVSVVVAVVVVDAEGSCEANAKRSEVCVGISVGVDDAQALCFLKL